MSVVKYKMKRGVFWKVDVWLPLPDGSLVRFRQRNIPTREQAMALVAKMKTEAFEGRYFKRIHEPKLTVAQAWERYEPITKRDNDAWQTDFGRAGHIVRHLGKKSAVRLTLADIDSYRNRRLKEVTRRRKPPRPATLDREVELLKRMLNYAVKCDWLPANPIGAAGLLRKPNVRRSVVDEATFSRLLENANESLRPILLTAYDTGMRKQEILSLRWSQVDVWEGTIRLTPHDTKSEQPRVIFLTRRLRKVLGTVPRHLHSDFVFISPRTGKPFKDFRKAFRTACKAAGLEGVWFHDLRRSFVTNARRRGVPESVVMLLSGHRSRNVFDRYNIITEDDLKDAVRTIERGRKNAAADGQDLDKVGSEDPEAKRPHRLSTDGA